MSPRERVDVLALRKFQRRPWHRPPHLDLGSGYYHFSAACFEHRPVIGETPQRMADFEADLLNMASGLSTDVHAWCILPNHYHLLVETADLKDFVKAIGKLHGRKSYEWNGGDGKRGRKVWHHSSDRAIRSERHFWVSMNYIHHNPVRHGYVDAWQDWPFSSAQRYLEDVGKEEAAKIWTEYPIRDYGKGWDDVGWQSC